MKKRLLLVLLGFLLLILAVVGVYSLRPDLLRKISLLKPATNKMVATGKIDVFVQPGGNQVGYFAPGQKFILTGEKNYGYIQVIDAQYKLWIKENSSYEFLKE